VSDKPFIHNEQAIELIDKMLDDEEYAGRINDNALDAFEDMRIKYKEYERELTVKQLLWVQTKALELNLVEEPAKNEWSSRTLQQRERIRGKEVPTPEVLLVRPTRPPHRLHELEKKARKYAPLTETDWHTVFKGRCDSKRGLLVTPEVQALIERAFREDRARYAKMDVDVFNETVPFGSQVRRKHDEKKKASE